MKGKIALVLCLAGLLVSVGLAASNGKELGHASQSSISAEALKGLNVTDLIIYVPSDVTIAKKIQVKAYYTNGTNKFTKNFFDVPAANGVVRIQFDNLEGQDKVDVSLQMDKGGWLEASAVVYLRPDMVIASANAAEKILVGDRLFVNVSIQEINGDLGADAAVALLEGSTVLDTVNVSMNAGGNANAVLSTVFASRGKYNLSVRVTNTVPAEYDEKNNEKPLVVSVVAPDLSVSSVTAPDSVTVGQGFEVLATISELNGETGANATVALLEGSTVLDTTKTLYVPAKGSGIVSLGGSLDSAGSHNMTVRITDSVPSDNFPGNNEQSVTIMAAVKVVLPDLAVTAASAPDNVTVGERFDVSATISELSGKSGANATIALLEGSTVLDTKTLYVPSGSSGIVSLGGILGSAGSHNMTVRIIDSVPSDNFPGNNEQSLVVRAVAPDLAVSNVTAPASVAVGQGFEVFANISELNGVAANATVVLLENGTVLDSNMLDVPAGGSGVVSLNASLNISGNHTLAVRIITSVPPDTFAGNNEQSFIIATNTSSEPVLFTSSYYYQITSLTSSRSFTDSGYEEKGEDNDFREDEVLSFSASSSSSLSFPLRVRISITNESGEGIVYEENAVVPALIEGSRKTYVKYYNDSNALLTLHIDESGTSLSLESKANRSLKSSSGYQHWWFKPAKEWNIATDMSSGRLIIAKQSLQARVELESSSKLLGSNALIGIVNESYAGEWLDNSAGNFVERKSVWIYKSGEILP